MQSSVHNVTKAEKLGELQEKVLRFSGEKISSMKKKKYLLRLNLLYQEIKYWVFAQINSLHPIFYVITVCFYKVCSCKAQFFLLKNI